MTAVEKVKSSMMPTSARFAKAKKSTKKRKF